MRVIAPLLAFLAPAVAQAQVAPECQDVVVPEGYNEQAQLDFMANYAALATSLSPLHGPMPHEPGHGAIGLDVGVIPPLGCERRLVAQGEQTWDPSPSPLLLKPRVTMSLPAAGRLVPYVGLAYAPPVKLFGVTAVVVSGELGAGLPVGDHLQLGARLHATTTKIVGELATPETEGDPVYEDLFVGSTVGFDAMVGWSVGTVVPYLSVGLTDASTFLFVGDSSTVVNNLHPYFGPAFSVGADALIGERFRLGAELYGAPGGYSLPDLEAPTVTPASRYAQLYTGRLRLAVEL